MGLAAEFLKAIQSGQTDEVKAMLEQHPQLVQTTGESGVSPLMYSVYYGQNEVTQLLLNSGLDLNIWEATAVGDTNKVQKLIREHPDQVNQFSPDGYTPLGLASFFGKVEILKLLLTNGADVNVPAQNEMRVFPIHSATAHRDPDVSLSMVNLLLSHGAEVNVSQQGGWTPLHQAAAHNHLAMVHALLARGADPTLKSEDGRTAGEMADEKGYTVVVQVLRDKLSA